MENKKCDCCQKEIGDISVKKYIYEVCEDCSIKILDDLSLVESTFKEVIKRVQKKLK